MIICADDFGLAEYIDQAILELAGLGRLSAVSVMASLARCGEEQIKPLLAFSGKIDIGLHLTLADEGAPAAANASTLAPNGKFLSFGGLLKKCYLNSISERDAANEIAAQYAMFVEKTGRAPDFIDGHMHVQQLPMIRDALVKFVAAFPKKERPYVRNAYATLAEIVSCGESPFKRAALAFPAKKLKEMLAKSEILTNDGFAGVYNYSRYEMYPGLFRIFTKSLENRNGILMTHPGLNEEWRKIEYETLREAFDGGIQINRFHRKLGFEIGGEGNIIL